MHEHNQLRTPAVSAQLNFERARTINHELHQLLGGMQRLALDVLEAPETPPLPAAMIEQLLERYAELTRLHAELDGPARAVVQAQHRVLVQPLFLGVPLIRRALDRPLGYPGDYMMVEMIFGAAGTPECPLARWLSTVILDAAPSRAHRFRAPWTHAWLDREAARLGRPLRVLSFACGPEIVLRSYVQTGRRCEIVLCDHEPRALALAQAQLRLRLTQDLVPRCIQLSVVELLRGGERARQLQAATADGFDVVLVLGLFDYLRGNLVTRMVRALRALLRPDGLLLASNLSHDNPHRSLMEYVADWSVLHRSPAEFASLVFEGGALEQLELTIDPNGANLLCAGRNAVR